MNATARDARRKFTAPCRRPRQPQIEAGMSMPVDLMMVHNSRIAVMRQGGDDTEASA
jgi:hypothetical protein